MFSFILLPSLVRLETSNFAIPSHSLRRFRFTLDSLVMSFISFTAEEIANAPKLEPSLEGLLLSANVKPQIIDAFRVQEVTSVNLMVALDSTEESFMKTCKQTSGSILKQEILPTRENGQNSIWCGNKRESHLTTKIVWTP